MTKVLIHQEHTAFITYMCLTTEPKNIWSKLAELKEVIDDPTIRVGGFNILLSKMHN